MSQSKRQRIREERRRSALRTRLIWIGVGVVILVGAAFLILPALQPSVGEAAAIMPDTTHVEAGEDPGPFNTDPPTSGRHYASEYEAGFYEAGDPETQEPYPEGFLVHNLEHGYVIFWYNCDVLGDGSCEELKTDIRQVMDAVDNFKVIAFPWDSIDEPVVMTSWGRIHRFERFDTRLAEQFVERNRNKAPEPFAP